MPEETTKTAETATVTETVEQAEPKSQAEDLDAMLARIPGLDKYFGSEEEPAKEPEPEEEPSSEEPPPEELAAEPEKPVVEAVNQEEEKKEVPAWVQKRIDKLAAQKHAAAEKAEALEARVKELEAKASAPVLSPTADSPLAHINSQKELGKQFEDAKKVKLWAMEHLDGGEVAGKDGSEYWDGAKVKRYLAWSEALITEHIPKRARYLIDQGNSEVELKKAYPAALKAGTEESAAIDAWVQAFPEVLRFPDYKLSILDWLAGQKMRLAKAQGKNGLKAVRNTPVLAAPSPSSGTKAPQKNALSKDLLERIAVDRTALDAFSESLIGTGS